MNAKRALGAGVIGAAMVGLGAAAAVKVSARRVRGAHDAALDDLAVRPTDVTHHRIATSDGGTLHIADTGGNGDTADTGGNGDTADTGGNGDNRPVVLLMHGVTLQWWVWSAVIALLRPTHRVLAWDMRGHGESSAGAEGVTLEACAADLAEVLEQLDLRDVIVVGHSMGGMVLGRFLVDQPAARGRVAGQVFLATSGNALSRRGIAGGLVGFGALLSSLSRVGVDRPRLTYGWRDSDLSATLISGAFGPRATARMIEDVRTMLATVPTATLVEAGAAIARHDVVEALEASPVDLPTAVVVGDRDRLTPPLHSREIARVVPGAVLRVLPGIGHQVMQEAPDEVVAAVDLVERVVAAGRAPTTRSGVGPTSLDRP